MREAFRSFDVDKSGYVTESKFLEGVAQLSSQVSEEQARQVFAVLD